MPSASAIRLSWVSAANSACGAPNPRKAPLGGVFVRVGAGADPDVRAAVRAAGVDRRRGDRTTGVSVQYAPPSMHDLDVLGDEPAVAHDAGPVGDDRRVALRRRGDVLVAVVDHPDRLARSRRARSAAWRAMIDGYSSLPPNPPPVSAWTTRACSASSPRPRLQRPVDVVRALERAVDRDAAVLARDARSSRCSRCRAAPGGRPGTSPSRTRSAAAKPARHVARDDLVVGEDVVEASGSKTAGSASVRRRTWRRAARSVSRSGGREEGDAARRGGWISPPTGTRIGWSSADRLRRRCRRGCRRR